MNSRVSQQFYLLDAFNQYFTNLSIKYPNKPPKINVITIVQRAPVKLDSITKIVEGINISIEIIIPFINPWHFNFVVEIKKPTITQVKKVDILASQATCCNIIT